MQREGKRLQIGNGYETSCAGKGNHHKQTSYLSPGNIRGYRLRR